MVDFSNNAVIVLSTLERYRYGPRIIAITRKCLDELFEGLASYEDSTYSTERALNWLDTAEIPKEFIRSYRMTISRLEDVYRYGRVLGEHLVIYEHPSEQFRLAINEYIDQIEQSGNYSAVHKKNIRHAITRFCCFVQYNGVNDPKDVSYEDLDSYDSFLRESSKTFFIAEGLVVGFLKYLGDKWESKAGFSLYMHYTESGRTSSLSELSSYAQETVCEAQNCNRGISPQELYKTIGGFVGSLKDYGYSHQVTEYAPYCLTILFLFLDRSGIKYNRVTVELWFQEKGETIFKTGVLEARRTYELYDDYIREGNIDPQHWWKHKETRFDRLPDWCREWIDPFIVAKEKEGWEKKTIKMYRTCTTVFCGFLSESGIKSFKELTAPMVKEFNAQDTGHRTPAAKNAYNSRIRKFLIYLEMNGVIPAGIFRSLPHSASEHERIVEVFSDDDKRTIDEYCMNAVTPLQLRDAAMLMLLIETALRACDIAALRASDIDWGQMGIHIIQKKTRAEHLHPLSAKTMNCLFRYIKEARKPEAGREEIFLKLRAPYGPVGRAACRDALVRAGVSSGRTHLARRSYATSLLKNGATIAETAEMLGHTDTSNVHKYTLLDSDRMRLCPLSLSETGLLLEGRYRHG